MAAKRTIVFTNEHWYHVFNRGIEGRPIFLTKRDYTRFYLTLQYYQYTDIPLRYSYFIQLTPEVQERVMLSIMEKPKRITISAYCCMPNHFHLLIRQNSDEGISRYISDTSNSYSKYFNTKNRRIGTLFQGIFKAVHIEGDEQMLHVSRYIHINPYVSSLCDFASVFQYPWSSLGNYIYNKQDALVDTTEIFGYFTKDESYKTFVEDQMSFVKKNKEMEHLLLE
jgi:putative transposase